MRDKIEAALRSSKADYTEIRIEEREATTVAYRGKDLETAHRDVLLGKLLDSGAELVESEPGLLREQSWTRMTDSQEALALALGDDGLSFYTVFK